MSGVRHSVRRESLEVDVANETLAFALQARLTELNRRRFLPAIERVLDELTVAGHHIRIDRLDLDLGAFAFARVEEEAEERLVRELRRKLEGLLDRRKGGTEGHGVWLTDAQAGRELLELYLLHGSLPQWAAERHAFSLEKLVRSLAAGDAEGLVQVVRTVGRHDYVLERIVAQLSDAAIRQLISLLEPWHAALILAYVDDLDDAHRVQPLLPLSDREMSRAVWMLVAAYLVQDPGSQFNRKSFVKSILEGLAASEGLAYAQILDALRVALEWTEQHHPVRSSLPAVVAELVGEWKTSAPASLPGRDADAVRLLIDVLERIPAPYRPRPEERVREAIFEALREAEGKPLDEAFYARVLGELFAWPLAEPVRRFLAGAADDQPEAFREAVAEAAGGRKELSDSVDLQVPLPPREADAVNQFMRILGRIPAPYRPRPEERIRRAILEALLEREGKPLDETFYARVLGDLFAWPLAEPVRRFLFEAAGGQPEAFRTAVVEAAGGREPRPEDAAGETLRGEAADPRVRERWAATLSEDELLRIAEAIEPRRHRELLAAAEVLSAAWKEAAPPSHPALTERRAFWRFMLDFLAREPATGRSVERLVAAFFKRSAARYLAVSAPAADAGESGVRLLDRADRLARTGGHTALAGIFRRDRRVLLAPWELPRARTARKRRPSRESDDRAAEGDKANAPDPIYIDNAGLVLAAPFLPQLFQILDFVVEGEGPRPVMRDHATASRAVHLLQYLVDGRTSVPEPLLPLNKILCGVPTAAPVEREIELTDREVRTCNAMLRSIVAAWTAIEKSSVAALQESFFRREGKLQRSADGWKLEVQRKTIDFLVDEVPWNLSVIFLRWMPLPIYVNW